jgi:hypothetical protein
MSKKKKRRKVIVYNRSRRRRTNRDGRRIRGRRGSRLQKKNTLDGRS